MPSRPPATSTAALRQTVRRNRNATERAEIIAEQCRLFTLAINALLAADEPPGDAGLWGLETGCEFDSWRTRENVSEDHARVTLRRFKRKGLTYLRALFPVIRETLPSFDDFIENRPFTARKAVKVNRAPLADS
jgi:hypothetical protein